MRVLGQQHLVSRQQGLQSGPAGHMNITLEPVTPNLATWPVARCAHVVVLNCWRMCITTHCGIQSVNQLLCVSGVGGRLPNHSMVLRHMLQMRKQETLMLIYKAMMFRWNYQVPQCVRGSPLQYRIEAIVALDKHLSKQNLREYLLFTCLFVYLLFTVNMFVCLFTVYC